MRRRSVRPFGSSIPAARALSMLVGLAVLWVLYDSIRQPAAWNWLAASEDDLLVQVPAGPAAMPDPELWQETVVPGPNDLEPEVLADFHSRDALILDRTALRPQEMIAYWQLLGWARTQPFAEFEQRASREPALTQIWEEPQKYRGKPMRLRLHVRRVLTWESAKNPLGVPQVYEAMGWSDESKSLPYTVIFTEKPPELPVGPSVEAEVVFVGYFLKIMTYSAFDDTRRGTPLMMGRVRVVGIAPQAKTVLASPQEMGGLALVAVLLLVAVIWYLVKNRGRKRPQLITSKATIDPLWVPFEAPAPATEFDPTSRPPT